MKSSLTKLGTICDITSSKRIFASEYVPEGVPFYRSKEIIERFNGSQNVSTELFITENRFEDISSRFGAPIEDDLLLTSVGTLGVPYLVKQGEEFYFKDGNLTWFRKFEDCNSKFIFYWLQSPSGKAQLAKSTIGTSQSAYTINLLKEMEICLPPRGAQDFIASILCTYDDLIENNRRRMVLLEKAARQLYQEWFVRLKFPGHEHTRIIDGVPEGWRKQTAFDTMQVMSGGTPKTMNPNYWDGEIPFYTPKDSAKECYIVDTEKHLTELGLNNCNSKLYPKDTIFVTARGTVGNLNLAQQPMAMNQSCYALAGRDGVSQKFLFCAMREAIQHFQQHAVGAVFDAIIVDTFKLISFIIPDAKLIRIFDETITPMFGQIENLLLQNQKLKAARDILLPRLMSGEVAI